MDLGQVSPYDAVYSNIVDYESQEFLRIALENAGVQSAYTDALLESMNKYNDAVGNVLPVHSGFEVFTKDTATVYDSTGPEKKWEREYKKLSDRLQLFCAIPVIAD